MKNKPKLIPILLILMGILLIIAFFAIKPKTKIEYFTPEPETWIEPDYLTDETEDIEINVYKATEGQSVVDVSQQDYYINNEIVTLFYEGLYKGEMFQSTYLDPVFLELAEDKSQDEQAELANEHTLMKIGPKINPNDNIINSFALLKEENNNFVIHLFVDEDWKNKVEYTNIIWGPDFNDIASLQTKQFDFSKSKDGIYMEKIDNNLDWLTSPAISGGIIVGEISKEILADKERREILNMTYMMVR